MWCKMWGAYNFLFRSKISSCAVQLQWHQSNSDVVPIVDVTDLQWVSLVWGLQRRLEKALVVKCRNFTSKYRPETKTWRWPFCISSEFLCEKLVIITRCFWTIETGPKSPIFCICFIFRDASSTHFYSPLAFAFFQPTQGRSFFHNFLPCYTWFVFHLSLLNNVFGLHSFFRKKKVDLDFHFTKWVFRRYDLFLW